MPRFPRTPLSLALLLSLAAGQGLAVEGMWQPHQLPRLEAELKAKGLQIDPSRISDLGKHPMNAVVGLGFCTASFVSPLGLAVTNHHCAYGAIQYNSTAERNLIEQGFYAKTLGEELPGEPTLRIYVTDEISEVTDAIRGDLPADLSGRQRFDRIDARMKARVAECEKPGGYRCDVYVFHGGAQYFLIRQLEIRDVRLVYAPAGAVGKYGGDIDNWLWPRHTGDFSYLRAYVGPDGKPADHSEVNVPYQPKSYLKVSDQGLDEGDFVMIAGYPGRTNRYRLAEEVGDAIEWQYPSLIKRYRSVLGLIDAQTRGRPEAAVKYAAAVASFNNGLKNFEGNLDGFKRIDAVADKRREEQAILQWAKENPQQGGSAAAGHAEIRKLLAEARGRRDRDQLWQLLGQSGLYATARDLYRISVERSKPNAEREINYQQRDEIRIEGRLKQLDRRFDPQVDRAVVEYLLTEYLALPASQHIAELDAWLGLQPDGSHQLGERLDTLYAKTTLGTLDERLRWFKADRAAIEKSADPALQLAVQLLPALLRIEDQQKTYAGLESVHRPQWMQARIAYAEAQGRPLYPDANNSLRVTFGQVKPYSPRDAVQYQPFTTLDGIVEKHTGTDPFDATQAQLDAIAAKRYGRYAEGDSVPVNFLADLDITGGNSGSPILNGKAELVGLAFDGNYEGIASGWLFNERLTRTIGVDARYMLWIMDAVDQADRLLEEMKLKPEL